MTTQLLAHLDDLIDAAARDLAATRTAGHDDGHDLDRASTIVLAQFMPDIAPEQRPAAVNAALRHLLSTRISRFIAADCLLDEADPASYTATDVVVNTLFTAVRAQGRWVEVLESLVVSEVDDRADIDALVTNREARP